MYFYKHVKGLYGWKQIFCQMYLNISTVFLHFITATAIYY